MDDFKLFAVNNNQLTSMIKIVNKLIDDIRTSFRIDNCKKLTIHYGKIVQMEKNQLNNGE